VAGVPRRAVQGNIYSAFLGSNETFYFPDSADRGDDRHGAGFFQCALSKCAR